MTGYNHFTLILSDDWSVLYKNGRLVAEKYSFSAQELILLTGFGPFTIEIVHVDSGWLDELSTFPQNIGDIPTNAFV